jgi:type IX secretion system PorP/SprF family membrane protein
MKSTIKKNVKKFGGKSNFLILIMVLCYLPLTKIYAQEDFNLTQYFNTPMLSNPASYVANRNINILFNYRRQPNVANETYTTAMLSGIYPLMNRYTGEMWGGVGLGVIQDKPGNFLTNTGIIGGYSHLFHIPNQKKSLLLGTSSYEEPKHRRFKHSIAAGLQMGFFSRTVDYSSSNTSSQFVNGALDPTLPLGENAASLTRNYVVFTPGVMWMLNDTLGNPKASVGVAWFNVNTPQISFYNEIKEPLPYYFNFTGNYYFDVTPRITIIPNFRWVTRSGSQQQLFGTWGKYKLFAGAGPKAFMKEGYASIGLWYNLNNAFVSVIQFEQPNYMVAMNFDFATTKNATRWQGSNVFEITVGLKFNRKLKTIPNMDLTPIIDYSIGNIKPSPLTAAIFPVQVPKKPKPKTKSGEEDGAFRFEPNSAELDAYSKALLDSVANVMLEYPEATIDVSGHTCDLGTDEANQSLSERRAEALRDYLVNKYEVAPDRIFTKGFGETRPLVPNSDENNRKLNRRVAFKVKYSFTEDFGGEPEPDPEP